MTNEPYPFSLGNIRLLHTERSDNAEPILLGTRTLDCTSSFHLFAMSNLVKAELETEIARIRGIDDRVHPTLLELRAAVSSITFFECVATEFNGRWGTPQIIQHDNWHRIFWIFVRLFECGTGFIAKWEDRYTFTKGLWDNEPRYSAGDLCATSLTDDCGKAYSLHDGETLLEYVDKV